MKKLAAKVVIALAIVTGLTVSAGAATGPVTPTPEKAPVSITLTSSVSAVGVLSNS